MIRQSLAAPVFAAILGAALPVVSAPVRASGENVIQFSATVSTANPCTGEAVTGPLDVLLVANRTSTGNGQIHVNVRGSVHGQLSGNLGSTYQVSAEGSDQIDLVAGHYDFGFHAAAVSHGSASNLTLDGVARVFVDGDGNPVGGTIVSLSANCL
jgi:hypothetical protein